MQLEVPAGWTPSSTSLTRTIELTSFAEALALILEIAKLAERANHHPDIDLRYRTVHISLTTHSAGHTLTPKDFSLAQKINELGESEIRLGRDELVRRFAA